MSGFKVGDRVKARRDLWEEATGDNPLMRYAAEGDVLIVRCVRPGLAFPLSVSHENVTDNSFDASEKEVRHAD